MRKDVLRVKGVIQHIVKRGIESSKRNRRGVSVQQMERYHNFMERVFFSLSPFKNQYSIVLLIDDYQQTCGMKQCFTLAQHPIAHPHFETLHSSSRVAPRRGGTGNTGPPAFRIVYVIYSHQTPPTPPLEYISSGRPVTEISQC